MKPYTLTEADRVLIGNFAGALNTGRALVPPAERFGNIGIPAVTGSPSIKWTHADELAALYERASQPDGAGIPVTGLPVTLEPGQLTHGAPVTFTTRPGRAQAFQSGVDGEASASIEEGASGVYGGVFQTLPTSVQIPEFTAWGAKAIQGLTIKAGQFLLVYSESSNELGGRADTRS